MESQDEALDAAKSECVSMREEGAVICSELADAKKRISELSAANAALSEINAELSIQRDTLRDQLAEARAELEDRKDAESQIKEFEAVLSKAEDMKRRYEMRISRLQSIIKDMKKASGDCGPEASELAVINMDDSSVSTPASVRVQRHKEERESEWLEELPD